MTDDDELAALLRGAAATQQTPPPAFDHDDVVTASHRITRRRRTIVGAVAGIVVVAGIGSAVVLPNLADHGSPTSVAAAPAPRAPAPPTAESGGAAQAQRAAVPLGPGTGGCANRQDPALRRLVDTALPEVVGATQAATTDECRPGAERGVNLEVADAGATGVLTVVALPPGAAPEPTAAGAAVATRPTASGGTVTVSVRPQKAGEPAPFADRVEAVAAALAPQL